MSSGSERRHIGSLKTFSGAVCRWLGGGKCWRGRFFWGFRLGGGESAGLAWWVAGGRNCARGDRCCCSKVCSKDYLALRMDDSLIEMSCLRMCRLSLDCFSVKRERSDRVWIAGRHI